MPHKRIMPIVVMKESTKFRMVLLPALYASFFIAFWRSVFYYDSRTVMKILFAALSMFLALTVPVVAADQLTGDGLTIAAVGDVMLGGRTEPFLKSFGPGYPFLEVMPILGKADLVVGNLESPVSTRGTAVENKKFTLRAGPIAIAALKQAGFRVVTLANNHMMDFGPLALEDTLAKLGENGILSTGAGMNLDDARTPAIVNIRGKTIAFLSYSLTFPLEFFASSGRPGTAPGYADFVKADIEKVRPHVDLIVVFFHWGAELLTAAKDYQIELGHHAIDWGADLVLGSHPHVLQELEVYKGHLIAYSLGNFVFGSESNHTNCSMILLSTFKGNTLVKVEAVPLDVNNYRVKYRPHVLTGVPAAEVLGSINAASERFKTRLEIANDRGTALVTRFAGTDNSLAAVRKLPGSAPESFSLTTLTAPAPGNSLQTSSSTSDP
jgi:poly-gamma-glutamate capsule biosynthesis protein CapA/YwtB (metallophosphatase superfamily)